MAPRVYDKNGTEKDMAWLWSKYGNVQFLDAGNVNKFALVRIDETEGPALIKARVLNEASRAHPDQPVANSWPDDELPDLRGMPLQTRWRDRAINQLSDSIGFTGFGLGNGSYIRNLAEGGPHTIWVLSPTLPSDGLSGIGMLGGTNHEGPLSLVFQIVNAAVAPPPPPPPPPNPVPDPTIAEVLAQVMALRSDVVGMRAELNQLRRHLGDGGGAI